MASWYEVFDNDAVQVHTRKRVVVLARNFALSIALALTVGLSAQIAGTSIWFGLSATMLLIGLSIWNVIIGMRSLRRVVWCVKISDRRIIGYDYARRKIDLDWIKVTRLELADSGLIVKGNRHNDLEISHRYPDFALLSHRIVEYAEFYEIPVYINGGRWEEMSVQNLYPFVESDKTSPEPLD